MTTQDKNDAQSLAINLKQYLEKHMEGGNYVFQLIASRDRETQGIQFSLSPWTAKAREETREQLRKETLSDYGPSLIVSHAIAGVATIRELDKCREFAFKNSWSPDWGRPSQDDLIQESSMYLPARNPWTPSWGEAASLDEAKRHQAEAVSHEVNLNPNGQLKDISEVTEAIERGWRSSAATFPFESGKAFIPHCLDEAEDDAEVEAEDMSSAEDYARFFGEPEDAVYPASEFDAEEAWEEEVIERQLDDEAIARHIEAQAAVDAQIDTLFLNKANDGLLEELRREQSRRRKAYKEFLDRFDPE